jgi:uncharacterized paraquat-inducible protein A
MTKSISDRQAHRHDHTDSLGRCKDCGGFLPQRERVICGNCGRPNRQYVSND